MTSLVLLAFACTTAPTSKPAVADTDSASATDSGAADSGIDSAIDTSTPPDTSNDSGSVETDSGNGSGGGGGGGDDTGTPPDPCVGLVPQATPAANRAMIQGCLDTAGHADLAAGVFDLDGLLEVRAGATLSGTARTATLRANMPDVNGLLYVRDNATVRGLVLDANRALSDENGAVVQIFGSNVTVSDCWIGNVSGHVRGLTLAGVYFMSDTANGSVVESSEIADLFYGVIFRAGLDATEVNTVRSSIIRDTACDGVTFAGYGELVGSTLYHHGYDCENGPIPGASVYGLNNTAGARIDSNLLYDDCGNIIDLDTVQHFEITNNEIRDPGYTWGGYAPYCGSMAALMMIDSAHNTIRGNTIASNERSNNRVDAFGDHQNTYRRNSRAAAYSDLGAGGASVIAFSLLQRPTAPGTTVGNVIEDNLPRAACSTGCTGIGYFSSRGTGRDAAGGWSTTTANDYARNNPAGSDIGSTRCGANMYAWDDTCDGTFPLGDCNGDDHQHTGFLRQDGCDNY